MSIKNYGQIKIASEAVMKAELAPVDKIQPNPKQPRNKLNSDEIEELVASIKHIGVIQPLLVAPGNGGYVLVAGSRRLEASKRAALEEVPCIIQDLEEEELLRYALIENLQREDLAPLEEAEAIKQLMSSEHLNYRMVADLIGKSKSFISGRLALLNLPDDLKSAVSQGVISLKKADVLKTVKNAKARSRLLARAPQLDLPTLRTLAEKARAKGGNKQEKEPKPNAINPELQEFAKSTKGFRVYKDRISFRFESEDELRNLLGRLLEMLRK